MNTQDRSLTRKLAIALAIKLLVLTGLWWGFVREQRVPVDTDTAAMQLLGKRPVPTAPEE
jgi:hypothetical protein